MVEGRDILKRAASLFGQELRDKAMRTNINQVWNREHLRSNRYSRMELTAYPDGTIGGYYNTDKDIFTGMPHVIAGFVEGPKK